jgi:hypothetical protein
VTRELVRPGRRTAAERTTLLVVGGICGLAWAAGLRGFMAQVAGEESVVDWAGTFLWVLLPGVVVGVLLGWAEFIRRTGGRAHWRWLALSPWVFAAVVVPDPVGMLVDEGIGGGAIAMPLFGMLGGYAIGSRGRLVPRLIAGLVAVSFVPVWALTVEGFAPHLGLDTPAGLWVALYFYSFIAVLILACAIPFRPVAQGSSGGGRVG